MDSGNSLPHENIPENSTLVMAWYLDESSGTLYVALHKDAPPQIKMMITASVGSEAVILEID